MTKTIILFLTCGELEASAYEYFHEDKYERETL